MKPRAIIWSSAAILALVAVFVFAESALAALFLGWLRVVGRILPRIEINESGIATGVVCLAITVGLLHLFAAWLYAEFRTKQDCTAWPAAWRWPWTFCVVLAVMLMFVAGLVGVGLFRTTSWFLDTPEIWRATSTF